MLSSASIYLAANLLNAAIPFALMPLLTRALAPAEYGTIAMFEAAIAFLSALTGFSTHGAIGVRYFKNAPESFSRYVGVCLQILFVSTVAMALVIAAAGSLGLVVDNLSSSWILAALLVSLGQFIVNIRLVIWQSRDEARRYGSFQVSQTALNGAVSIALVLGCGLGAPGRMGGIAIATLLAAAAALLSLERGGLVSWRWSGEFARDALHYGLPLIPHALGVLAVAAADRFIVTSDLGVGATGLYFAGVQLAAPMLLLGSSFNRAYVPWLFARLARRENAEAVLVSYSAIAGLMLAGVAYAVLLHYLGPHVLGPRYQQAERVALILVVGTTFQAAYYAVVNYIFFEKRTAYLSATTFSAGIIYVATAFLVVPNFGLGGLAWLYAAVQAMTFACVWLVSARVSPQPWLGLRELREAQLKWSRR